MSSRSSKDARSTHTVNCRGSLIGLAEARKGPTPYPKDSSWLVCRSRDIEFCRSPISNGVPLLMGLLQNSMSRLRQTSQELSLGYGVGPFLASAKPIKEPLQLTVCVDRASLEDLDDILVFQRNPYWDEFQSLTNPAGATEPGQALTIPMGDPLVRQMTAVLKPFVSEAQRTAVTALVPFLDPENEKQPLLGFLK